MSSEGSITPQIPSPLRLARLTAGLRQTDIAALTGLSREAVLRLELGYADPRLSTALALAQALGRPVEELWPINTANPEGSRAAEEEGDHGTPSRE
jgi:transcriptional regulator with XRE-family HTH domain